MMKRFVLNKFSTSGDFLLEDFEAPRPKASQVLIQNQFIGFNPVDFKIAQGKNLIANKIASILPWTPGYDVVGTVCQIGESVTNFKIGDQVLGMVGFPLRGGTYATHTLCEESELALMPKSLSPVSAVSCALSGLTAMQAITALLDKKWPVFVLGGTGGVGESLLRIIEAKGIEGHFAYRSQKSKLYLKQFKKIQKHDLSGNLNLPANLQLIDCVGGDVANNFIQKYQLCVSQVITIPTYSFDRLERLCTDLKIPFHKFIVQPNQQMLRELICVWQQSQIEALNTTIIPFTEIPNFFKCYSENLNSGRVIFVL
jgi:NADPH:quinone reductase